jgi:hypothetical protein
MRRQKADEGLDFEALRVGIERCDLDVMLGFYAEDAQLSIVNAKAQRSIPFELHGKTEIAKHLRAGGVSPRRAEGCRRGTDDVP